MKEDSINLIIILCIGTIFVFGFKIGVTLRDYGKADKVYSELREMNNNNNKITKEENENTNNEIKDLSDINSDYKFWINVEGTNIDYPVVQGNDNDFYLNHDFNKNYLSAGSIFLDYRNNFETDYNTIIYGHHMKNATMFGQMEKFKDKNFFDNNKTITITTKDTTYEYEIFAIGVYDADFGYNKTDIKGKKEFNDFLNKITDKAMYTRNININNKIITLSTCSYEYDNARTVIFAVRK